MSDRPTKPLPRFLPTLTEVVEAADLPSVALEDIPVRALEGEALADRITALLEPRAAQLVNVLLSQHMLALESRLYAEMSALVRKSVAEALSKGEKDEG